MVKGFAAVSGNQEIACVFPAEPGDDQVVDQLVDGRPWDPHPRGCLIGWLGCLPQMMVPVVFVVLPISVLFALFPGFYDLSLVSP